MECYEILLKISDGRTRHFLDSHNSKQMRG